MNQYQQWASEIDDWYTKLPWYWKIIGCLVLVLGIFLTLLSTMSGDVTTNSTKADKVEEHTVEDVVDTHLKEEQDRTKKIVNKKAEAIAIIKEKQKIDDKAENLKQKVDKAESIEEVDDILKKAGL